MGTLKYLDDDGDVVDAAGNRTWAVYCLSWKAGHLLLDFANPVYIP